MKGIQDFSASKARPFLLHPLSKQLQVSQLLQVRLPELPLEVWGPFVFVIADAGAEGDVAPVREQMQAVQVMAGSGAAVLVGLMLYAKESFERSSGWDSGDVPWRSLKVNYI